MIAQGLRDRGKITEQSFSLQHLRQCCFSTMPKKDELCQAGITTYQNTEYAVMSRQHIWEVLSVCHSICNHGKTHLDFLFGLFLVTWQYVESKVKISFMFYLLIYSFIFKFFFASPYISLIYGLDGYFFLRLHQQQTINKLHKLAGNMFLLGKC